MGSHVINKIINEYNSLCEKNKDGILNIEEKAHYDNLEHILITYKFIIKDEKSSSKCHSDIDNYNYNKIMKNYEKLNKKIIFEQERQNMNELWSQYEYNSSQLEDYDKSTNKLFEK
jgi:methionine synthase II (cobalamin-independent)